MALTQLSALLLVPVPASAAQAPSQPATALAPAASAGSPVITAAGDIANPPGSDSTGHEKTAALIESINPDLVLTLGDNQHNEGKLAEYMGAGGYNDTWGRFKSRTRPVPGNKDYMTAGAAGYFDYFNDGGDTGLAGQRGKGWYSYDLGAWHIVALNSEADVKAGSAQEQWLRADLAANARTCSLAYFHRPFFSSQNPSTAMEDIARALYDGGVDVILSGHVHTYERLAPQTLSGARDPNGIRQFIVGTGGHPFHASDGSDPNSEVDHNSTHGVLKMTLHPDAYDWAFVPVAGQTFTDTGSTRCGAATNPGPSGPAPAPGSPTNPLPPSPLAQGGYWLVASDGGIFSYGNARFHGSTGNIRLNQPIVGMAATPSKQGYWLVASDGGIFAFGDAAFFGSTGNIRLVQPIVGMTTTPSGDGYWLVASDGGVFAFGDATFEGSTGNIRLARPITAMTATRSGEGYWMTATDGGIFNFGDAGFHGSAGNLPLAKPIVAMSTSPSGNGYLLAGADGAVFAFGDAVEYGNDLSSAPPAKPIVGMTGF
ncbi:MAG: metallophosphoesterase family protein [Actinomycetota bacterium]